MVVVLLLFSVVIVACLCFSCNIAMIVDISSRRGYSYWMTIDNKALSTQIMFSLINPWNYFYTISTINVVAAAVVAAVAVAVAVAVALFFVHP
jgi:hypothetical protein